jgi:signal recognition particle subunit SEC65
MLEHYPGAEIIKSILNNKSQIDTVAELKTVWKALGLRIATEDEEKKELPRKIIEENWDELEKNTHIFKLPGLAVTGGGKPPPKYYFGLAKATAQNWGRVPGHNMVKGFPASHIIQEYTNEPTAQSLEQLKILWRALGLEIATEEEEATLPRRLIEMNWREISKNTGIRCRLVQEHKTDEPKIKYFFEFAHGRSQWGKVSDIKSISNFPNPDFIRSVTGKDSIITAGELKKVWKALGIEVATDEEEKKLPKWLIEDSWSNITKHSGIILLPTLDGYKYHFRFAKQAKDWGGVRAAGDRKIQYYPSGPFVTSILGKKRVLMN